MKSGIFLSLPCPALKQDILRVKNAILHPRFVEKYQELEEEGKIEEEKLFEETGKALLASGILLQRRGVEKVSIECSLGCGLRKLHSQP